jgi:aspartyl-tRNA(Asn)/glutamyl-tRNA(Gln) amidotransferase subunit B
MLRARGFVACRPYGIRAATYSTVRTIKEGWEAVIGIEVHAQINTKTKLFSGKQATHSFPVQELTLFFVIDSPTSFNEPVNTNISVIDAAYPGVQPVQSFENNGGP